MSMYFKIIDLDLRQIYNQKSYTFYEILFSRVGDSPSQVAQESFTCHLTKFEQSD